MAMTFRHPVKVGDTFTYEGQVLQIHKICQPYDRRGNMTPAIVELHCQKGGETEWWGYMPINAVSKIIAEAQEKE